MLYLLEDGSQLRHFGLAEEKLGLALELPDLVE
jgi:hypothetical protein